MKTGDTFPAPREQDCRFGCCKAGDVGLWSEVVKNDDGPPVDGPSREPVRSHDLSNRKDNASNTGGSRVA